MIAAAASRANAGRMDTRAGGAAVSSADSAHSFAHIGSRRFARADKKQTTEDGFDATFATNTLGTFLMTVLLVPWLHECAVTAGEPSRVITVSSGGMLVRKLASGSLRCLSPCYSRTAAPRHATPLAPQTQKMCVSDLQFNKSYEGTEAYAQTKVRAVAACWYSNRAMVSDNLLGDLRSASKRISTSSLLSASRTRTCASTACIQVGSTTRTEP